MPTMRTYRVKKVKKAGSIPKPPKGSYVRLKTLEEICILHGVRDWEDVREPEIADQMIHLFGHKVKVTSSSDYYRRQFQAVDPTDGSSWYFRNDWIDIEKDRFKIGNLPDELFEI